MGRLFGTDGIRAAAGEYPLDPPTVRRLGRAVAQLGKKRVLIGRDTRASGLWIELLLQEAIQAAGGETTLAGVITTPGVSCLCRAAAVHEGSDADAPSERPRKTDRTPGFEAGIMISASHNPYYDNGIKIFSESGLKLSDEEENEIEALLSDPGGLQGEQIQTPVVDSRLLCWFDNCLISNYVGFLKGVLGEARLSPLRIAVDCANGSTFHIAPRVFEELGAEVEPVFTGPDGCNINLNCGALHPEHMAAATLRARADLGVAFDGDGDRAILADEQGQIVDGDHMLLMLGRYLRRHNRIAGGCVVTTVMANMGLEVALRREGLRMVRTKVGDRFVLEEMLKGNHPVGGEQSGHIIIREHSVAGDGILTALKIAQIVLEEGRPLSELRKGLDKLPQVLLNVRVREKRDFGEIESIRREIERVEQALNECGRVLVRYSGTEPLVRIMVEGENAQEIQGYAEAITARFREEMGA
jgi:phosphoglucosamine mutase